VRSRVSLFVCLRLIITPARGEGRGGARDGFRVPIVLVFIHGLGEGGELGAGSWDYFAAFAGGWTLKCDVAAVGGML
jgi:hypothetical protein